MGDYRKSIENLAENKETLIYNNSGKEHATIVLSTLFKHTEHELRIVSGKMADDVLDNIELLENLQSFVIKGGGVKVLLDNHDSAHVSKALKLLMVYKEIVDDNRIIIKKFKDPENWFVSGEAKVHFTTGDVDKYRIETDTNNFKASGSFNSRDTTQRLVKSFDEVFSNEDVVVSI